MSSAPDLSSVSRAIENDFNAFRATKGSSALVFVSTETFDSDAVVKISFDAGDEKVVNAYARKLKKQFGYVSDGEGEEFAVDLVIPVARAAELAGALENPSKTKLAKEFNTVVFTGTMTVSRAEAKSAAEEAGFRVSGSVSKNTGYLVAGDNPGSNEQKAHDLGVKVLTEAQWARVLKKSAPK
jgi:NAD-dependent DNA ligase